MECLHASMALLLSIIPLTASAQTPQPIPLETAQTYFSEAQSLCQADHGQPWGISLCGPIMFVDPQSRSIVASQPDAKGLLKAEGGVFVGRLPTDQNIANTAVEWSGTKPPSGSAPPLRTPSPGVSAVIWEIRSLCKVADRRPENVCRGQFFAMPSTLSNPVPAHECRPNLWGFCMMDRAT